MDSGRTILILSRIASNFRGFSYTGYGEEPHDRPFAWWAAGRPCRPAAVPAGAQPHRGGLAGAALPRRTSSRSRPAALQVSPGNETHLHAFATDADRPLTALAPALSAHLAGICLQEALGGGRAADFRIRQACSATASAGALHHPEFTMLEWYRAREPYDALMSDCAAILALAAEAAGTKRSDFSRPDSATRLPRPSG